MIDVVCGVIEDAYGRFLACKRPQGKHLAGLWEFPGGKVDPDESAEDALTRELKEELGIDVTISTRYDAVIWSDNHTSIRLLPFRCTITRGIPQALEHEQLQWCAPADFHTLRWAEADLPIIAQILAGSN